jgi:hypothetical protein
MIGQLSHYNKIAPCADSTIDFVEKCLEIEEVFLSRLNVHILDQCTNLLNIDSRHQLMSELGISQFTSHDVFYRFLGLRAQPAHH